jgi:hypothetical protein
MGLGWALTPGDIHMTLRQILFAIAAVTLSSFAQADGFDIKTGAWEVTSATAMSGTPIPKEALDKMQPAQRAKMEAAMAARAGKTNSHTTTTCVTKQELDRGQLLKSEGANCTRKVVAQTARHYEMEETCTGLEPWKTHAKFDAKSAESYTAVIDRQNGDRGKVHVEMTGRWLGAACKKGKGD